MNSQSIICSICIRRQVVLNASNYVKHMRLFHEYSPSFQFTCGMNGCPRSYHNVGTFKNHVSEAHTHSSDYFGSNDTPCNSDVPSEPLTNSSSSDAVVNTLEDTDNSDNDDDGDDIAEMKCSSSNTDFLLCSKDTLQKSSAMFLIGLKEKFELTEAATQEIVEGVTNLFKKHIAICVLRLVASWL